MGIFKKKENRPQQKQATLTVYANLKGYGDIPDIMAGILQNTAAAQKLTSDGVEFVLQDGSKIVFHFMVRTQIPAHITGMEAFFLKAPVADEELKKSLVQQMIYFNSVIGIEFTVDDNKDRTEYLLVAIYMLAAKIEGFVLHPNMCLYCSDRRLLISADGKTDFTEYTPKGDSTFLDKDIPEEQADIDRRLRSIEKCKQMGLPVMESLKASVYESECVIPSKENIVHRLACIFAAAVCSEACNYEPEKAEDMIKGMLSDLEDKYSVSKYYSAEEMEYAQDPLNYPDLHPKFGWRYECCAVLLWALSLWELGEPTKICDAGEIGKIIWNNDFDSLCERSELKSKEEILDMQDLMLRYDWACVDARINGREMNIVDEEIVYEWHYALNWLTNANYTSDWDIIRADT
ncbi:MAG: DUF4272 domain-containing protein [Firmicutes bacterium]|nr:DUF4272 domain-containing protein [[Eubacterium] siraeum]MCM1487106.1 DUF4272 domain-containing protein [Bacillota bacterium]